MRRATAIVALVLTLVVALGAAAPLAHAEDPPPAQQALLLLRILAYDRQLKTRSGGKKVVVAVTYKPGDKGSEESNERIVGALEEAAKRTTVLGMPVEVVQLPYDGNLADRVSGARAAALYICPGLEDQVGLIWPITRRHSVLSLSPRPEPVKNGIAVGFAVRGSRTAVIVNLTGARAEGVDFESSFLRVAEVIQP